MVPLYFGSSERSLYGVYHPPEGQPRRNAVVICGPLPQETFRASWMIRQLASTLAKSGTHALRFDWSGCGDSSGTLAKTDLTQWRRDLCAAVRELGDLSGGLPVSAVGVGIGASLALTTNELQLRDLVLWDPVVRGASHLSRLIEMEEQPEVRRPTRLGGSSELLGFAMSAALKADIAKVDLLEPAQHQTSARRVCVMDSEASGDVHALRAVLASGKSHQVALPERFPAAEFDELLLALLAPQSVQRVAAWLVEGGQ